MVRIKNIDEIKLNELPNPVRVMNPDRVKKLKLPHLYFSDLFNAYTQALNKKYNRTGTLFEGPFKRIKINNERYFRHLIIYIHTNPVHHGFIDDFKDYPWSSYGSVVSIRPTKLSRDKVLGWFDDRATFIEIHKQKLDFKLIEKFVIE